MTALIDPTAYKLLLKRSLCARQRADAQAQLERCAAEEWEDAFAFDASLSPARGALFIGLALVQSFHPVQTTEVPQEEPLMTPESPDKPARWKAGRALSIARRVPGILRTVLRKAPSERASVPRRHPRGDR